MKRNPESYSLSFLTDDEPGVWITTFADLITLLLVFFIMLYSFSSLNQEKFKFALNSIQSSLKSGTPAIDFLSSIEPPAAPAFKITIDDYTENLSDQEKIQKEVTQFIDQNRMLGAIAIKLLGTRILIRIKGHVLFQSGSAEWNQNAEPVLDQIIKIIQNYPSYHVNIKGYTDNMPIATRQFPSNWDLSAIRATNVLKYFINADISAERMTATGYGEMLPLVNNDTEENRAINRRVEFVLEKKSENESVPTASDE